MSYLPPAAVPISASWQAHKDRTPPSSEPGTDYATAYGTPVAAAASGTITDLKNSSSSATGRYVTITLDDGRTVRYLHLAESWVSIGQRVGRGQQIGLSGASGYGNDWYYGPHVHVTLWPGQIWAAPTIDFTLYVGEEEEDDMNAEQAQQLAEVHQALYTTPAQPGGWPGVAYVLGDVQKTSGEVHQAIYAKASDGPGSWDGLDKKAGDTLRIVKLLGAAALGVLLIIVTLARGPARTP